MLKNTCISTQLLFLSVERMDSSKKRRLNGEGISHDEDSEDEERADQRNPNSDWSDPTRRTYVECYVRGYDNPVYVSRADTRARLKGSSWKCRTLRELTARRDTTFRCKPKEEPRTGPPDGFETSMKTVRDHQEKIRRSNREKTEEETPEAIPDRITVRDLHLVGYLKIFAEGYADPIVVSTKDLGNRTKFFTRNGKKEPIWWSHLKAEDLDLTLDRVRLFEQQWPKLKQKKRTSAGRIAAPWSAARYKKGIPRDNPHNYYAAQLNLVGRHAADSCVPPFSLYHEVVSTKRPDEMKERGLVEVMQNDGRPREIQEWRVIQAGISRVVRNMDRRCNGSQTEETICCARHHHSLFVTKLACKKFLYLNEATAPAGHRITTYGFLAGWKTKVQLIEIRNNEKKYEAQLQRLQTILEDVAEKDRKRQKTQGTKGSPPKVTQQPGSAICRRLTNELKQFATWDSLTSQEDSEQEGES